MRDDRRRTPRLFLDEELTRQVIRLGNHHAHYLRRVLRLRPGSSLVVFNGRGEERRAVVDSLARENTRLRLERAESPLPESPLQLTLVQGVAKSDAMDMIIQKSTELGVRSIVPVLTEFSVVKLNPERSARRLEHWNHVAQSACEQCGRHRPPAIYSPQRLADGLASIPSDHPRLTLHPNSERSLQELEPPSSPAGKVSVLVGPEGGLSAEDLEQAARAGFEQVSLGPRILRSETAAVAACALAQARWGDLVG
jgi:16S rRNA (uracil1498-N3)-methyltransferase